MDLFGFDPPPLDDAEVARIAHEYYGLDGRRQRLRGERSLNTLFTTDDGHRYVLKIASSKDPLATIEFHARALRHLEQFAPALPVARMVPALDGALVPVLDRCGVLHGIRLVTFLPGVTFDENQLISDDGLARIGALVGALSAALADFDHPAADEFMPWDMANGLILDRELWAGLGDDARAALEPARERLERASEIMSILPRQVIHNDAHAGNLLRAGVDSDVVTGVIDFGDLVRTAAVADLGVSGANLVPQQVDPVAALTALVRGFHSRRPVAGDELAAVPELVLARLALSTLFTDHQIRVAPHIADAVAAERPSLLANLRRWLALDPDHVLDEISTGL